MRANWSRDSAPAPHWRRAAAGSLVDSSPGKCYRLRAALPVVTDPQRSRVENRIRRRERNIDGAALAGIKRCPCQASVGLRKSRRGPNGDTRDAHGAEAVVGESHGWLARSKAENGCSQHQPRSVRWQPPHREPVSAVRQRPRRREMGRAMTTTGKRPPVPPLGPPNRSH